MKTITYLHSCNAGDLICALPGMRHVYRTKDKKAIIRQILDMPGNYYAGAVHSVRDDKNVQVTMNRRMFDMLSPLLLAQDYIAGFQIFTPDGDQQHEVDLTVIREKVGENNVIIPGTVNVNIPYGALPSWLMLAYPQMACDFSQPWIETPGLQVIAKSYILINRTQRYGNEGINYTFLKKYQDELLFIGTETEHQLFCKQFKLDFNRLQVDDFLELAEVMKMCRFFLGNQSFPWNLANALGIPRLLEMCHFAPNCQPFVGENNYGFLHQLALEYYFELLYSKKATL